MTLIERIKELPLLRAAGFVVLSLIWLAGLAGIFGPGEVWALLTGLLEAQGLLTEGAST